MEPGANAVSSFEMVVFPQRRATALTLASHYRVYTAPRRYLMVEAETAAEALKMSGIAEPLRIERDLPGNRILLERDSAGPASPSPATEAPAEPVQAEISAEMPAAAQ